eukprot:2813706-Ditylum_brightwellii.AAC.1
MFSYPLTWDDVYDMDNQITAPMHTLGPDMKLDWCKVFSADTENFGGRPVECWTTFKCRQYLKYFALPSGKAALDTRKKAAEFYHDDSVCKVPPEER